ncbi:Porin family protein [Candidatus Trichorickettsia mobilis]|uniref:Porin family protein n=1 Tax=Candidatus Trichorickettsia mobilis TaxID=1346319 RepID=A0ABZ0UU39_9RICK|nr:porin [Candidatus Trichorickettsia mobilis]WPY01168.1 Porin family protein [Candidatus Trichorickettsia mobilis]
MIKKLTYLLIILPTLCSINTLATTNTTTNTNGTQVKLKGGFEFQSAFHDHNVNQALYISKLNKQVAFNSSGHMNLDINNTDNDAVNFGAKIGLEITTKNDRKAASSLYLITNYGKLELGSDKSATNKMKITGYSIGAGTVGSWDNWTRLVRYPDKIAYIVNFGNFLDSKTREGEKVEYSRKITYFSPNISGFQLGISYIPDSTNTGYAKHNNPVHHNLAKPLKLSFAIKDGIGYGLSFEHKAKGDLKIKTALVGERGITRVKPCCKGIEKFTNLNTYLIGSEIHYKQYALAASYGNYLRSLTSPDIDESSRSTYLYGIGGRYEYSTKIATSLHYFFSKHKTNKFNAITFAADYKIASGLLTYTETTHYTTNGQFFNTKTKKISYDKTKGTLLLAGLRLEF